MNNSYAFVLCQTIYTINSEKFLSYMGNKHKLCVFNIFISPLMILLTTQANNRQFIYVIEENMKKFSNNVQTIPSDDETTII